MNLEKTTGIFLVLYLILGGCVVVAGCTLQSTPTDQDLSAIAPVSTTGINTGIATFTPTPSLSLNQSRNQSIHREETPASAIATTPPLSHTRIFKTETISQG
jgi:hypothetical protein